MDARLKRVEILINRVHGIKAFQYPNEADRREALDLIHDINPGFEVPQIEPGASAQYNALLLLLEKLAGIFTTGLHALETNSENDLLPPLQIEEAAAIAKLACGPGDIVTKELKRLAEVAEARYLAKTIQDEMEAIKNERET